MARSTSEIYNSLIAEKENFSSLEALSPASETATQLLGALNSRSNVAIWRLLFWVFAWASRAVEELFDRHKEEVFIIANAGRPGTSDWLLAQSFAYEDGNGSLTVREGGSIVYAQSIPELRIVKAVALRRHQGGCLVLVAKDGSSGYAALSPEELGRFNAYLRRIQIPGTRVGAFSAPADVCQLHGTIYFDGTRDQLLVMQEVEAKVGNYLRSLDFGTGELNVLKIQDVIQACEGVVDFVLEVRASPSGGLPNTVIRRYLSRAGHMIYDSAGSTINWQSV